VRKASHCGSKQQQRSPDEITLLLLVHAIYIRGGRNHFFIFRLRSSSKIFKIRVRIGVWQFFIFVNPTPIQTPATIIDPTVIYQCFYLINDHTDSCYCRSWKMTPDPGPDPVRKKEKHRILMESTPAIRIRSHLWYISHVLLFVHQRWHGPAVLQPGPPRANMKLPGLVRLCQTATYFLARTGPWPVIWSRQYLFCRQDGGTFELSNGREEKNYVCMLFISKYSHLYIGQHQ